MIDSEKGAMPMTFGEKLKKLRKDNEMTQEELAGRLFVTRTAVSKWETDKGYPAIDSLKAISDVFHISLDDLISEDDVKNQRALEDKQARKMYYCAMGCLLLTVAGAFLGLKFPPLYALSAAGMVGYVIFALLSRPKYKRMEQKRRIVALIIGRVVVGLVLLSVLITVIQLMGL